MAKLLGLPYPGGPHVERLAATSDAGAIPIRFRGPCCGATRRPGDADYYDVSFSGLKTAVLHAVRGADLDAERGAIARAFQDALIETLVEKTARAARAFGRTRVVLGGGVACNGALRPPCGSVRERDGATSTRPTPRLATDNAAMIARAGLFHLERGERSGLDLNAFASHAHSRTRRRMIRSRRCRPDRSTTRSRSRSLGFTFTGFGLAMLLAFLIAQIVCRARARATRPRREAAAVSDVFAALVGRLLGAKLYYVIV